MSAFDDLQKASFAGVGFAVTAWRIKGGIRHHTHEYPGSPGGQTETLGRRLYTVEYDAVFSANDPMNRVDDVLAFTEELNTLRILFEKQEKGPLVIPHLGTIDARATDWDESADPVHMRDGIKMKIVFLEESEEELSIDDVVDNTASSLASAVELLIAEIAPLEIEEPDLFESLEGLANEVQGVIDQVNLAGDQLGAKIAGVTSKMEQLDASASALGDPSNYGVTRALHNLGASLAAKGKAVVAAIAPKGSFVTPSTMSVTEVSIAVFGDTSHALDILKSNRAVIDDAYAIPAETTLKV